MTTLPEFIHGAGAQRPVPLPDGQLTLLGATDGVTPSMHLVEMGGAKLLIDCGVSGPGAVPSEALAADALILTHAHNDHLGGLPEMLAIGFNGPIFATAPTLEIVKVLLKDSIYLNGGDDYAIRAFKERFKHQIQPMRYDAPFEPVKGKAVQAVFREAGHILGSASVELLSKESRVILSGDLGRPDSPILRDYHTTWSDDRPVDLVLMETTYGNRDHAVTPDDLVDQFEEIINTALRDGGHILVPSFAIGRTQVLLYLLNELVESGRIANLPVAVDTPMGLKVTNTYRRFERLYDRETLDQIAGGDRPRVFVSLFAG
jgi:metallo-beta-lactamase family protein